MQTKISLLLLTLLMMFPQVIETIYSPALPEIAVGFNVSAEEASQTLSFYFFAFAVGIVFWGRCCDKIGRRMTVLAGLSVYGVACLVALFCYQFKVLLCARMLMAFGAAIGSIGTQTIVRDIYQGVALARIFSIMGIALASSPAIGLLMGTILLNTFGYQGVFTGLVILALILLSWSWIKLPETLSNKTAPVPLIKTSIIMIKDKDIWCSAFLVAFFNLNLFSYYQLAPFYFQQLGLSYNAFGYSGLVLTFGVGIGAYLNKYLLLKKWRSPNIVLFASLISIIGSVLIELFIGDRQLFMLSMILIVMAYGLAIPNILSSALTCYADRLGTSGALLGLFYYLLLGIGLVISGFSQNLGLVLMISSSFTVLLSFIHCVLKINQPSFEG